MKQIFKKIRLKKFNKLFKSRVWFWLLIIFIWLFQLFYTLQSNNKIRLEELAESVRNVFWLQNRTIYDGISSNVGWYGTLLVVYNLFGFTLFTAKYFRLIVHLLALLSLGAIFNKYFSKKTNWLPLITIGLSPTLLYFNTLQTSFGIDLQYFPICLYLLLSLNFSRQWMAIIKQFFLGSLMMVASMSYPTFLAYIPVLAIIYFILLWKNKKKIGFKTLLGNVFILSFSFFLPLIMIFSYLREPRMLIYDAQVRSGIFRGGGGNQMSRSLAELTKNVISGTKQVRKDLFLYPGSYYFEADIARVEFSQRSLFYVFLLVLLISFWMFIKIKKTRIPLFLSWILVLTALVTGNFSGDLPGIRRSVGVLAAFYTIYTVVWNFTWQYFSKKNIRDYLIKFLILITLLLVAFHHLKVYRYNLNALSFPSSHAADACFNKIPGDPAKSLEKYLNQVKKGERLYNAGEDENGLVCRLHAVYAATAGSCLWNNLNCPPIYGYDENTGDFILLSTELWENYYFGH